MKLIRSFLVVACLFGFAHAKALTNIDLIAGQDRGGGNVFEAEFRAIGHVLLQKMKDRNLVEDQIGFPLVRFQVALDQVNIVGTDNEDQVKLGDNDRQAVNSVSEKTITFKNSVWAILNDNQKSMLVLHEYLRFTGVDDSEYAFSLKIADLLALTPPDPAHTGHTYQVASATPVTSPFDHKLVVTFVGSRLAADFRCGGFINGGRSDSGMSIYFYDSTTGPSNSTLLTKLMTIEDCQNSLSYIATTGLGAEVYIKISPEGVEIY